MHSAHLAWMALNGVGFLLKRAMGLSSRSMAAAYTGVACWISTYRAFRCLLPCAFSVIVQRVRISCPSSLNSLIRGAGIIMSSFSRSSIVEAPLESTSSRWFSILALWMGLGVSLFTVSFLGLIARWLIERPVVLEHFRLRFLLNSWFANVRFS